MERGSHDHMRPCHWPLASELQFFSRHLVHEGVPSRCTRIALTIHVLQRCLVRISLLVATSASTEILHAPEKDIVVSKNANVSGERSLFSEHNGGNSIFLARLIPRLGHFLIEQEYLCFKFIPQWREKEWETAREGEGNRVERCFYAALEILLADSHDVSLVKNIT